MTVLRAWAWLALVVGTFFAIGPVYGQQLPSGRDATVQVVREILQQPEGRVDFARAKLAIDQVMSPEQDARATELQLNRLVDLVNGRVPSGATDRERLDILISTLYQPGPWNDRRPFRYDLGDPMGANLRSKQLSTYLATRKGNCVSMPVLFVILGQKLGLPVTLATAPQHVMVKFLDSDGQWLNVEATAGGFKYDSSYIRETSISETALRNDIYLRPLTPRESVAVMASTLMEHFARHGQFEREAAVADLALEINAKDVTAMVHKGGAYYMMLRDRFMRPYPNPALIPRERVAEFQWLSRENLRWYNKAEELGWAAPTEAQDAHYMKSIQQEKAARGKQ